MLTLLRFCLTNLVSRVPTRLNLSYPLGMNDLIRNRIVVFFFPLFVCLLPRFTFADKAVGTRGAIATVQPIATEAGLRVLDSGGNALDAAVAAALMLGVVDSHNSGLGGGCFVLIRRPNGAIIAIDGREEAPAGAHQWQ